MKTVNLCLLLLAAVCPLHAGKAAFSCTSNNRGNIQFDGREMVLNVHFRNNGEFQGQCREILRIADFSGNGEAPVINEIELNSDSERKHSVTIPAEKRGCFYLIYSLMQNDRIIFRKSIACAKLDPIVQEDPKNSPLGVYVHQVKWNGEKELPVIKNMGFSWIRDNCNWNECQSKPGEWNWSQMDACMKVIRKYDMNITLNLVYAPSWAVRKRNMYGGTPANFQDFAEFAARACTRYPDVIYWSIWNEPDAESHWSGGGKEYARLLKTAVPKMRKANPNIKILPGGVTGLVNLAEPFMREVGKNGGGEFFDVYDFHYKGLEVHKKIASDFNWKKPFWNTELSGGRGIRRHVMPRDTIKDMALGLEKVLLFIWNIRVSNQDHEAEFGPARMVDNEGHPNFNFPIVYALSKHLNGISKVEDCSKEDLRSFRLSGRKHEYWTCWKKGEPRGTFAIRTEKPLTAVTVDNISFELVPVNGMVFVPADDTIYLNGEKGKVQPTVQDGFASILPLKDAPVYGKVLQVPAELRNPTDKPFSGTVKLGVSADWTPKDAEQKFSLRPGEKKIIHLSAIPRRLCDLSESRIFLTMLDSSGKTCGFDKLDIQLTSPLRFTLSPAFQWGKKKVQASVENKTASGIHATLTFQTGAQTRTIPFTAAPMTISKVYFTPDQSSESVSVDAVLAFPGGETHEKAKISWHEIPSKERLGNRKNIILKKRSDVVSSSNVLYEWSGEKDLSVEASLFWTPERIVLEADVTDDVMCEAPNIGSLWMRDSLQVWFDGNLYDFGILNGKAVFFGHGENLVKPEFSITRSGTVTSYRIAFPKKGGGKWEPNNNVAVAFIVNDADLSHRKGWIVFRNDIEDFRKRKKTEQSTLLK